MGFHTLNPALLELTIRGLILLDGVALIYFSRNSEEGEMGVILSNCLWTGLIREDHMSTFLTSYKLRITESQGSDKEMEAGQS